MLWERVLGSGRSWAVLTFSRSAFCHSRNIIMYVLSRAPKEVKKCWMQGNGRNVSEGSRTTGMKTGCASCESHRFQPQLRLSGPATPAPTVPKAFRSPAPLTSPFLFEALISTEHLLPLLAGLGEGSCELA